MTFQRYLRQGKDPYGFFIADLETGAYGWSLCSPRDKFNRKMARQVAIGRLNKHEFSLNDSITGRMLIDALPEYATRKRALFRIIFHAMRVMEDIRLNTHKLDTVTDEMV
jgi:hypothetical protein